MFFSKRTILQVLLSGLVFFLLVGFSFAQVSDDINVSLKVPEEEVSVGSLILTSPTHLKQKQWYSNNNPKFTWSNPDGVSGFSYVLNKDSDTIPDNFSEGTATEKTYTGIADGVWYFHLKALGNSQITDALHYKVNIDVTPPEFEYLRFREGDSTTTRRPTLEFSAVDMTSGVDYFEYKIK